MDTIKVMACCLAITVKLKKATLLTILGERRRRKRI
jgi:hypothetical protein